MKKKNPISFHFFNQFHWFPALVLVSVCAHLYITYFFICSHIQYRLQFRRKKNKHFFPTNSANVKDNFCQIIYTIDKVIKWGILCDLICSQAISVVVYTNWHKHIKMFHVILNTYTVHTMHQHRMEIQNSTFQFLSARLVFS